MAPRVRLAGAALAALALAPAPVAAGGPATLASYSFDDDVATGPDTFRVFEHAKGKVRLSSAFHVSGWRSIEIRDVAGDGDFPELQGYLPLQRTGRLFFHFSFLTATPAQELNVALAGPKSFGLGKDGIAFWLRAQRGVLVHWSDSIPKRLLRLEPFVWYTVDVAYDIGAGVYDLTIRREGQVDAVAALARQPNAASQPGSAVDKFSFVGDPFADASAVTYYVDDVVVSADAALPPGPFVAPGRRKLLVDWFAELRREQADKPTCLPVLGPEDFGLNIAEARDLAGAGLLDPLATGARVDPATRALLALDPRLDGVLDWSAGCAALAAGRAQEALRLFQRASAKAPSGRIHGLSAVLSLLRLKRMQEADEQLGLVYAEWRDDARYAVAAALAGSLRGDLDRAEAWLRAPADQVLARGGSLLLRSVWSGEITPKLIDALKGAYPEVWRSYLTDALVSEQYYFVLLWSGRHGPARDFALRMAERFRELGLPARQWLERAGDAAFSARDLGEARQLYEQALSGAHDSAALLLRLSDVAFLEGDLEAERALRERVYGALRED